MELAERLIIGADYDPRDFDHPSKAIDEVINLAKSVKGSGVTIKVNSALRFQGSFLIHSIEDQNLGVMADYKLDDIKRTMELDAAFLRHNPPRILTVKCTAGEKGMHAVQETLRDLDTKVAGVTVLTSMDDETVRRMWAFDTWGMVRKYAKEAQRAGLKYLVAAPTDMPIFKRFPELNTFRYITPGIRPEWTLVDGDDQTRVMTPKDAIVAGADYLVIGRPIIQAKDRKDAIKRTLDEIEEGLEARKKAA